MKLRIGQRKIKLLIFFLCLLISIGYGAISSNLKIRGKLTTSNAAFDIAFQNLQVKDGSVSANTPVNINTKTGVTANFMLNYPGDYYEFTLDVKNNGSIDGMIKNIVKIPDTNDNIKCEITYGDDANTPINNKDKLAVGETFPIKVRIINRAGGVEQVNLIFSLEYTKADSTATNVNLVFNPKLTVDLDGGSTNQHFESSYPVNQEITLIEPTKTNYYFSNWEIVSGDSTVNDNILKMGTQDTAIKAVWSNTPPAIYCTYNGDMTPGAQYVNGQYTYVYKQEKGKNYFTNAYENYDIVDDGWGVYLTDSSSTAPVTSQICTYINNKPVVSSAYMFAESQAESIDLSSFNTSNVKNMMSLFFYAVAPTLDVSHFDTSQVTAMDNMFYGTQATSLDLSHFDTSKVVYMNNMFWDSNATTLDLSSFDTSSVVEMNGVFYNSNAKSIVGLNKFDTSSVITMRNMFSWSQATELDLSSFDTSQVFDMLSMFAWSQATTLDLSSFNTKEVTNMSGMFDSCAATTIDVSNFNTGKTTDMSAMFSDTQATELDVSSFNTSNVTTMSWMFAGSLVENLSLNNFDTRNVTDMSYMFNNNQATSITGLNKFKTKKVTTMTYMFDGSQAVELDLSHFNTEAVTDMSYMFNNSQATIIDVSKFDTSQVTTMYEMFAGSHATVLDLSSFDTTQGPNMFFMLDNCWATTGYAKNQTEADKFNDAELTYLPTTLHFIVKA